MSNTDIKWFSFDNTNAPQLTNTWGCMIDVLDACLVNGFGSQIVSSIVIENGVGVATFGSAHNIKQFQVVEFSGASISLLNDEFKVLGLTTNTIEFLIDLPDQVVTGTISCALASLGWRKAFSGENKAVYLAKDAVKNPYFLRVDDSLDPAYTTTFAKFAKVGILESCLDIDDISGIQAPFDPADPSKNWVATGSGISVVNGWHKWYYALASGVATSTTYNERSPVQEGVRKWHLVGNEHSFYIFPQATVSGVSTHFYGFGVVSNINSENNLVFLSASNKKFGASNPVPMSSGLSNRTELVLMKNDENKYQNQDFGSVLLAFGVAGYNADYFKRGNGYTSLMSPAYMIDNLNCFVGAFPLLLSSLYRHTEIADATPLNENGRALMKLSFVQSIGVTGSVFFDLGEYY